VLKYVAKGTTQKTCVCVCVCAKVCSEGYYTEAQHEGSME